ncbi:helix-turn-helix transcriptional regulator [Actinocrinis sp.]|uniref:helix-turn-helix domain-containing protein n=1 Tax=Actinocrinis sp. TaxID=1920516 RepID=UPI002D6A3C62|nr:helix-turn-helix transcriptional regulator [Actinocrinis sp.]HZP53005.1 helix-turn-helix transcriptional regulator [Actinocrinis sp.]
MVLGKRLEDLRKQAGLGYEEAAAALDVTHSTIRRMEKAEVSLKILYVDRLLRMYGVTEPSEIEAFLALVREANQPGWWHRYRDVLPDWFSAHVSLEVEAALIRAYEPHYVHGLLQTPDYARTVLRAGLPHAPDPEINRLVDLRVERQSLLDRENAPRFWGVMDETVFRRAADRKVLRAQVDRLIEACSLPNVTLQVMPFAAGPHPAMYGPFCIFRFRFQELPDIVYGESLTGAVYIDDRDDVSVYLEALDRMCAQAAPAPSTEAYLSGIRKEI